MADTLGKKSSPNLLLIILLAVAVAAAGYLYWMGSETAKSRSALFQRVGQVESEKTALTSELSRAKEEASALQRKIEEITKALAEAKAAEQAVELELKHKTDEINTSQNHYETRIAELERDVKRYADFSAILATELKPIKEALLSPAGYGSVSARTEIQKGASSSGGALAGREGETLPAVDKKVDLIAGQVLAVNREYGFIVTSIGSNNGAEPGRVLQIYRRGEPLGLGRIERSQNTISAASVVSEDLISRVQKGDRVVLL